MDHPTRPLTAPDFPALAVLEADEARQLQLFAEERHLAANVPVIVEGERPDGLFFVGAGFLRVSKRHGGEVFEVGSIGPGEIFGEASILHDAPAGAEVRTVEPCVLYALPVSIVRELLKSNERFRRLLEQIAERRQAATALAINPVFSKLPIAVREVVRYNARFVQAPPGAVICAEGAPPSRSMLLVLSGEAEAYMRHPADPSKRIVFARLGAGDEIGEISLITGKPQAATVRAVGELRMIEIDGERIDAWRKRYPDFGHALYAAVQRKLQHALDAVRRATGENLTPADLLPDSAAASAADSAAGQPDDQPADPDRRQAPEA